MAEGYFEDRLWVILSFRPQICLKIVNFFDNFLIFQWIGKNKEING